MSNRPSRKVSHSAQVRVRATDDKGGSRVWWFIIGGVLVVAIAGIAALVVTASRSSNEPTLDAQATRGKQVALDKGCVSCHSSTGNRSEGPTWKGLYGKSQQLTTGATVTVDDAYLTTAIRQPDAQIPTGFRPGMPTTPLTDDELAAVIAYIKALR